MNKLKFLLILLIPALLGSACSSGPKQDSDKLTIVCTTGMIGDGIRALTGPHAEVVTLMGAGVDPHLYKATSGDLKHLSNADLIFYNGLHLEGKMGDVLEKMARQKPVIPVGEGLNSSRLLHSANFQDAHDPHIWFDVSLWQEAMTYAGKKLAEHDPEHADFYGGRSDSLLNKWAELHDWVKAEIATVPEERRVLVTAHDAFEYFGNSYGIEVRGLQGISTVSEYGLRDVTEMVDFISERGIKAVFVESSVPMKSLEAVVEGCLERGHQVRIGGTLYSDAMGQKGTPEGTYEGMVRANVSTIVSALK